MCINGKRQNTRYIHIDEKDKIQDIHIDEKKIKYKIYIYTRKRQNKRDLFMRFDHIFIGINIQLRRMEDNESLITLS